ncbi:MAG: type II toxin-antitoxin system RelE/ParE family toxin [Acidobacteriota bacterium]|jgi:plasmid stabilization system protein ParE|nr:type II toxin-antitoxin system RelE/ParE family toxin [Acidobacteriota bacterium]
MTNYKFNFVDEAKKEYEAAARYYLDNGGIDVAERFVLKVDTVIEMLEMWPNAGRNLDEISGIKCSVIPKYPYQLYYRLNDDGLEVIGLSVYHTRRDLDKLLPELKKRIK